MKEFGGIRTENGKTALYTGISERDFAQAKLLQYLTESGYIARKTQNGQYSFTPWSFTETASAEDGTMVLYGENFSGVSLSSLFSSAENEKNDIKTRKKLFETLQAVFTAAEEARKKNIYLPWGGISAVLVSENGSLLFLPATLHIRSLQNNSDTLYSQDCGCYVNQSLPLEHTFTFTAAVLVYRLISGKLPYAQKNTELRTVDYYDADFIPLDLYENENTLTQIINAVLGKKKREDNIPPLSALLEVMEKNCDLTEFSADTNAELEKKREIFLQKQAKKTKKRRFLRKNKTLLTVCAVCFILLTAGTVSFIKNQAAKETTAGLTALETAEMFYSAYNNLNIDYMSACLKRGAGKDFINFATNIYVTLKVRQAYESLGENLTPEQWFALPEEKRVKRMVFGMLDFTLNGKKANSQAEFDFNRDKTKQTGTTGQTEFFTAEYYFLTTQGESGVLVLKRTDSLTLEYLKNRWLITDIVSQATQMDNENGEWTAERTASH